MATLSLRHIYKIYPGNVKAVSDFNLEIDDKEFVVFVGPSGCGKSTTLRMVAGLEEISEGELYIDGRLVNDVEPKDRDIAMVFQNYALYPHMTVYDNMAFGLKLRKMPRDQIEAKVQEAANILGIQPLLTRKPKALSGGQRQRVALGRAIVRQPKVFLLDEPLSNLDAKLRVQMRTEITKLHNKLATTFIYVTHDQTEAMTMGTRIVVMKDGFVQQVDTPQNLYDNPVNHFVATFIGTPQMNMFKARLEREGNHLIVYFGETRIEIPASKSKRLVSDDYIGKEIYFGVRPEDIHNEQIFVESSPRTTMVAEIDVLEKLGNETILYMKAPGKDDYIVARVNARSNVNAGETIKVAIDAKHIHLFDTETELTILGIPKVNYIEAKLVNEGNGAEIVLDGGKVRYVLPKELGVEAQDRDVLLGVKTANVYADKYYAEPAPKVVVNANVALVDNDSIFTDTVLKHGYFVARHNPDDGFEQGQTVKLAFNINRCALYDTNKELLKDFESVVLPAEEGVRTVAEFKLPDALTPADEVKIDASTLAFVGGAAPVAAATAADEPTKPAARKTTATTRTIRTTAAAKRPAAKKPASDVDKAVSALNKATSALKKATTTKKK
ncbi:hypothetical protein FACS1894211_13650 [Clostridia bacterium]|nr:hypothetical protein FACS1894211_13650 [Clostridia bacterium]